MIKCPNCKNSIFKIGIIHSESTVNYVDNDFTFEPTENSMNSKIIECTNCQTRYDLSDKEIANRLINPTETCSKCGKEFTSQELDENKVCTICRMKELDPSFANFENADPFTMIRMLAMLKMENINISKENEKISKELERAKEIEEEEKKPKKRGRKKKDESDIETEAVNVNNTEVIDVDNIDNNESDIEITDDAPDIPGDVVDMSQAMNPPEE